MEIAIVVLFSLYVIMGIGAYNLRKRATGCEDLVIVVFSWPIMLCVYSFNICD